MLTAARVSLVHPQTRPCPHRP